MAADIIKLDLTDVNQYIAGAIQLDFFLTTFASDGNIILASGRVEEVGGFFYRVEGGDLTVSDSGIANGDVSIIIIDDGDGTATAKVSDEFGVEDSNKGGFYINGGPDDGAKVIFAMTKATGPIYSNRGRLLHPLSQERGIGEIFGIHPDTLILPNPFNFSRCDGVELFDTAFIGIGNDTKVPDLTDDRFLQGDNTYVNTGANTININHSHTVNGHNHQWFDWDTNDGSPDRTFNSGGSLINISAGGGGTGSTTSLDTTAKSNSTLAVDSYTNNSSPGTDAQLSTAQDIRPKRFSVLYYIRIR